MTSARWSSWGILIAVTLIITVLDQFTKYYVTETLGPDSERRTFGIIPSVLQFRYVENTGAAFGIFQDSTTVLVFVSFGVIAVLAIIFWSMIRQSALLGFAFGLQLGGAFGNLIDRIRLGYVVDFIDVPRFPTFNVADSGITVGVVILSFVLLFYAEEPQSSKGSAENSKQVEDPVNVLTDPSDNG